MHMDYVKLSVAELFLNSLIDEVADHQPFIPLFIENPVSHNTRFLLTACPFRCKHRHLVPQIPQPFCQALDGNRNAADEWFVVIR